MLGLIKASRSMTRAVSTKTSTRTVSSLEEAIQRVKSGADEPVAEGAEAKEKHTTAEDIRARFSVLEQHLEDLRNVDDGKRRIAKIGNVNRDGTTRRFFTKTNVKKIEGKERWEVLLDNRAILTPKEQELTVPTEELAYGIAAEWEAQIGEVEPRRMPLLGMACTAMDSVALNRQMYIDQMISYFEYDSICTLPQDTKSRFYQTLNSRLPGIKKWFEDEFKLPLDTGNNVNFRQAEQSIKGMEMLIRSMDDWTISGLEGVSNEARSLVTALALWNDKITIDDAYELAVMEMQPNPEAFLEDVHGVANADVKANISAAAVFLKLLNKDPINLDDVYKDI